MKSLIIKKKSVFLNSLITPLIVLILLLMLRSFIPLFKIIDIVGFLIFVIGYNIIFGYLGLFSLGHMTYFGLGAYILALYLKFVRPSIFEAMIISAMIVAGISGLIMFLIVRLRTAFFALANLAFNHLFYFLILIPLAKYTGGEDGLPVIIVSQSGLNLNDRYTLFWFSMFILSLIIIVMCLFEKTLFHKVLISIKENETRTLFLGYNTKGIKIITYIVSAIVSSIGGMIVAINNGYVTPTFISPYRNPEVIFATLLGGPGKVYGAIVGGFTYSLLSFWIATIIQTWELFLGVGVLIIIFIFKGGIYEMVSRMVKRRES
ncbi:MAG: branched-chain amino acid ABC transporter permease [Desulfurococcaceae archaeon]